jgi:hypothetical protein
MNADDKAPWSIAILPLDFTETGMRANSFTAVA